jgi:hypothetical protein
MASLIVYLADTKYIGRTLAEIADKTPPYLLEDLIICNDTGQEYENDRALVINSDRIGRSKCWNEAAKQATSDELVFLRDTTKLSKDWLQPLISRVKGSNSLVSPRIHTLNTDFWSTENESWRRFGWRWDLSLYSRQMLRNSESPAVSSNCIAVTADWFEHLGGFDEGMVAGVGEDIELSIRSWLFDGKVEVEDDSLIAVRSEIDNSRHTINNLARIVEIWMPKYSSRFYSARDVKPSELDTGKLSNLMMLQDRQIHKISWFLERCQPELGDVYDLRGTASGKSVAVIGPGASVDLIDPSLIYRHDLIISVDYMGMAFESDYVVTDLSHVAVELRSRYRDRQFVLPLALADRTSAEFIAAGEVVVDCYQFELSGLRGRVISDSPPFCNFEQSLHSAVNFALFLNPRTISLFGCDNKIVGDRSHSAKIEYYDDGRLWPDSDATRRKFAYSEFGIGQLGNLAYSLGIPLIRMNHT